MRNRLPSLDVVELRTAASQKLMYADDADLMNGDGNNEVTILGTQNGKSTLRLYLCAVVSTRVDQACQNVRTGCTYE